jgi:hypothetical protein
MGELYRHFILNWSETKGKAGVFRKFNVLKKKRAHKIREPGENANLYWSSRKWALEKWQK